MSLQKTLTWAQKKVRRKNGIFWAWKVASCDFAPSHLSSRSHLLGLSECHNLEALSTWQDIRPAEPASDILWAIVSTCCKSKHPWITCYAFPRYSNVTEKLFTPPLFDTASGCTRTSYVLPYTHDINDRKVWTVTHLARPEKLWLDFSMIDTARDSNSGPHNSTSKEPRICALFSFLEKRSMERLLSVSWLPNLTDRRCSRRGRAPWTDREW